MNARIKPGLMWVFSLAMANTAFAGVELHYEMGSNNQYVCDAFTFGGTTLSSTTWGAMSPLFLTGTFNGGLTATFECDGDSGGGAALLDWSATDGSEGSASHGTHCAGTEGGGSGGPGGSQCIPVNGPCPDPKSIPPEDQ